MKDQEAALVSPALRFVLLRQIPGLYKSGRLSEDQVS